MNCAHLICTFVFAYAKSRLFHDVAHVMPEKPHCWFYDPFNSGLLIANQKPICPSNQRANGPVNAHLTISQV